MALTPLFENPTASDNGKYWRYSTTSGRAELVASRMLDLELDYGVASGQNITTALNQALTDAGVGGTVFVPNGTWWVTVGNGSGTGGIIMDLARQHLILAPGAELKAVANSQSSYHIVWVSAADCVIAGGKIVGDVGSHTGGSGEWGHGVVFTTGADRSIVRDTEISLCWGDGINMTGTAMYDCRLSGVRCYDNRRNGCSIVSAERVLVDWCEFTYNGTTGYTSPGAGIDWEPNGSGTVTGQMSNCLTGYNAGPGVAVGGLGSGSTTRVRISAYRSFNDNQLGASGLGECSLMLSSYCTAEVSGVSIIGGRYGVYIDATAKATLSDVLASNASLYGFLIVGPASLNGCTSRTSGGSGFYVNSTADSPVLMNCVVEGAGTSIAGQGFDIYGDNATLIGCVSRLPGASMAYSYVVRTGAASAKLFNCVSVTAGTSGHYVDQTSAAVAFPKPGATFPPTVTGSKGANAALTDLLAELATLGLVVDSSS